MPNTTTATWPTLTAGTVARASDVEAKFDFSKLHLWPHNLGNVTDNTYDIGNTATAAWRAGYFYSLNATSTARGLAIGTTTVQNNSNVALEIAGIRSMLLPRLTTTQRDNLTGINGMVIYNSTANQFQMYQNGAWTAMGGGASTGVYAKVVTTVVSSATQTTVSTGAGVNGRLVAISLKSDGTAINLFAAAVFDSFSSAESIARGTTAVQYIIHDLATTTANVIFAATETVQKIDLYFRDQLKVFCRSANAANTSTSVVLYERSA